MMSDVACSPDFAVRIESGLSSFCPLFCVVLHWSEMSRKVLTAHVFDSVGFQKSSAIILPQTCTDESPTDEIFVETMDVDIAGFYPVLAASQQCCNEETVVDAYNCTATTVGMRNANVIDSRKVAEA